MDANNFYHLLLSKKLDVSEKQQLIFQFKTYIKKNIVRSPNDGVLFLKALQYVFNDYMDSGASSAASTIQNLSMVSIGHLVKRISCQSENDNLMALSTHESVLPFLFSNLNHSKVPYRVTVKNCILDFWLAVPSKVEGSIKDYLLENVNNIKSIFIVNELLKVLLEFCENNNKINLSIYFVSLVRLYQFSSFSRSSVNISINEICKKLLQFSFSQSSQNRTLFLDVANSCGVNKNALDDILNISKTANQSQTHSLPLNEDDGMIDYDQKFAQVEFQHEQPKAILQIDINLDQIQAQLRSIFNSSPLYKLEEITPTEFGSLSYLLSAVSHFEKDFQGRETEFNWSKREKNVAKLRSIIRSDLFQHSDDNQKKFLFYFKENLLDGVNKTIHSLRTTLSTNGCKFIKELFQLFNIANFDHTMTDFLFKNVIRLTTTTKKINNNNANVVIFAMLDKIFELKTFDFRILNMIYDYSMDKNLSPRIFTGNWLSIILLKHPRELAHITDVNTFSSSHETNALKLIEKMITKGLNDPNPSVREQIRKTFWILYRYYPEEGINLHQAFSSSITKLLDKVKPSDIPLPPGAETRSSLSARSSTMSNGRISGNSIFRDSHVQIKENFNLSTDHTQKRSSMRQLSKSRSISDLSHRYPQGKNTNTHFYNGDQTQSNGSDVLNYDMSGGIGKPIRLGKQSMFQSSSINSLEQTTQFHKPIRIRSHSALDSRSNLSRASSAKEPFGSQFGHDKLEKTAFLDSMKFNSSSPEIPKVLNINQDINDDILSTSSSREDTDSEINNSIASKLVIREDHDLNDNLRKKEYKNVSSPGTKSSSPEYQEEIQSKKTPEKVLNTLSNHKEISEIEKVLDMLSTPGMLQRDGMSRLVELVNKGYKFSMSDYSALVAKIHELTSTNPSVLFQIVDSKLINKIIDIIQLDDLLKIVLLAQESKDIGHDTNKIYGQLIDFLTYDEVMNGLLKYIKPQSPVLLLKVGLINLRSLLENRKVYQMSSNKQSILDKTLTSLVMLWQDFSEDAFSDIPERCQKLIKFISKEYKSCFKIFIQDTFEQETGESKNVLIGKKLNEFSEFVFGKQKTEDKKQTVNLSSLSDTSRTKTDKNKDAGADDHIIKDLDEPRVDQKPGIMKPQVSGKSLTSNWDVTLSAEADNTTLNANQAKAKKTALPPVRNFSLIPEAFDENNEDENNEMDFGFSPIKIEDLKRQDEDGDQNMEEQSESNDEFDNLNEMTRIIPYFKTGNANDKDEPLNYCEMRGEIQTKSRSRPTSSISASAESINKYIEVLDPLKPINASQNNIPIYKDSEKSNGVYNRLLEKQIMKYRLIHYKLKSNDHDELFNTRKEEDLFDRLTIEHIKAILNGMRSGSLSIYDSSLVIFVLGFLLTHKTFNESSIGAWVLKDDGYDEIFDSVLHYMNAKSLSMEKTVLEVLMIVKLLVVLSDNGNLEYFDSSKLNKYWVISEKLLQMIGSGYSITFKEEVLTLMEEIIVAISVSTTLCTFLLNIVLKSLIANKAGTKITSGSDEQMTLLKYYLNCISKVLISSVETFDAKVNHKILDNIGNRLPQFIDSDDGHVRREVILILSAIFKIDKSSEHPKEPDWYKSLMPPQQKLVSCFSDYI